jgi:hypothetical protein
VTTIADRQVDVASIATNGTLVVWSAGGRSLSAAPVGGKAPATVTVLVQDTDITGQLTMDGESVFYTTGPTSSHGVIKCPIDDCKDDFTLGYDLGTPSALAVDQGDVFALETTGRRVLHCGTAVGSCDKDIAKNTSGTGAIALGLDHVYWSVLETPGAIYSCPRSGCDGQIPTVFAAEQRNPRALAVDLNAVWWTSYDDGTVSSCPLAGCPSTPSVVARGQKNPLGIATDGTHLFWANAGDGTVMTCEAPDCTNPRAVARGLDRPQWLTLDGTHVYFATAGGVIGRTLK